MKLSNKKYILVYNCIVFKIAQKKNKHMKVICEVKKINTYSKFSQNIYIRGIEK